MTGLTGTVIHYRVLDETPVGRLLLAADDRGLRYLLFAGGREFSRLRLPPEPTEPSDGDVWRADTGQLDETVRQLRAYFSGKLTQFALPLAPQGTDFQSRVWAALCEIPWGETMTYGELACRIGQPTASRAVGLANGRNPISILIPCHRVIGRSGHLVGYGGGLITKQVLLELENSWPIRREHQPTLFENRKTPTPPGVAAAAIGTNE